MQFRNKRLRWRSFMLLPRLLLILSLPGQALFAGPENTESAAAVSLRDLPVGSFTLEEGSPIFAGAVVLQIQDTDQGMAISLQQRKRPQEPGITREQPSGPQQAATIQGLIPKGPEYLYGRLMMAKTGQTYRCKLWQRGSYLFLRVYDPFTYYTFKFEPTRK